MDFKELLQRAKDNDHSALTTLLTMYRPLLMKKAIVNGVLNEDLYQELSIAMLRCIQKFRI